MNLLDGITVIDLSHRLPGPMAGKVLSDLGANVIKIEDEKFRDPFLSGLFSEFDQSFLHWYENLNKNKNILRFDFNSEADQKKIYDLVSKSDIVIMGLPDKTREKLKLTNTALSFKKPFVLLELLASKKHNRSMHDLNSLAESGLLKLHVQNQNTDIIDPPFLPLSGIALGHKGATDALAALVVAQRKNETLFVKTYLDEATDDLFGIFWPETEREKKNTRFLHNGAFPCYSIYRAKDGEYVALASVEEKFWKLFCEKFNLDSSINRFHNSDRSVFDLISKKIKSLTSTEIEAIMGDDNMCLSLV